MDEILLIGAGGHARACIDVIELTGMYKIAGLVERDGNDFNENIGYPIIGTDKDLPDLRRNYKLAIVAVGQIKSAATRIRLFNKLNDLKYELPVIISPRSYVSSNCKIGAGTMIMHDVMVSTKVKVGNNCIINNKALIEHDTIVGDHCHIATAAIINGNITIGNKAFIGSGVVTKQGISIGSSCTIGLGVVLKNNLAPNQVIKN